MTRMLIISIALSALVLWAVGCGGGGGGARTPTGPSDSTPPPAASVTVNIVSSAGSGAFNPNPVQVPSGGTIQWTNMTANTHVLVMSDGAAIGTVGPNASITTAAGAGGNFRCANHPSMVGSINRPTVPPPTDGGYDY